MKSLFSSEAYSEIKQRIEQVDPKKAPEWGKMNVSQMLRHCQKPLEIVLGKETVAKPNLFKKLLMKSFKGIMYSDKPWKHNLPTVKEFVVSEPKDFEQEKNRLHSLMEEFNTKDESQALPPHPLFGAFTNEQWGKMQYKHLDHHLRQFGA